MENPYEILGVPPTANAEEIKAAYRRAAKETHPDLHDGSAERAAEFRAATDAYAILSDPAQRRRFDETGSVDSGQVLSTRAEIFAVIQHVRSVAAGAKGAARWAAFKGALWLAAGVLITGASYSAASSSPEGGTYFVMWGAILFGGLQAIRALVAYVSITVRARSIERGIWSVVTNYDFGPQELG